MECWTCGNRFHVDNDCPYRVKPARVQRSATTASDATTTPAPAATSPALANAQVSRITGRARPDSGGDNGENHLNGEDGKEPRRRQPPTKREQPRFDSKEDKQRAANAHARTSHQAGTATGTDTGATPAEDAGTASGTLAADPAPETSLSPWVQALVNPKVKMNAPGLRRAGRSRSASSSPRPPWHPPKQPQPLLLSEASAFFGSSSARAVPRRRSIAVPRTAAETRRVRFPVRRKASVRGGTGPNARGSPSMEQDAISRRKVLGVAVGSRREQLKRPRRISGAVVAYQAAKHAVEDLFSAPPARRGALLLASAFAVSASSRTLFLTLWGIVLGLGVALWIRANPPRPLQPGPLSYDPDANRRPRRAQPWVHTEEGDDGSKGTAEPSCRRSRGQGGVLSVENTRRLVMALALGWFAVDTISVLCFFRLVRRAESPWLALALFQASVVYAVSVGGSVSSRGPKKLQDKTIFRYLLASWHLLLILAVAAAVQSIGWDRAVFREGVGSALVSAAAWQLARISRRRVERSARYGMVVSLGKVLRNVDHDRELSEESMLELAFGRWLVDYWSQLPRFSAMEMRSMLGQAASSLANGELHGRTPTTNSFGPDATLDGSDWSSTEAASVASESVAARVEYLTERPSNSPPTRLEAALEPLNPSWWSSWVVLLAMACPCLCALALILLEHVLWDLAASWTRAAFLSSLAGPVGVEVLRLKMLRGEVMQTKAGEELQAQAPGMGSRVSTADSLGFLLRRTNPELSCVLSNARLALESLRRDRQVDLDIGNGHGREGVTIAKALQQTHVVFHDKTRTLRDVADGIGKEGGERSASWITRESTSPPAAFFRSIENASSRGRISSGSTRADNSPARLGLTSRTPPSPQRPLPPPPPPSAAGADTSFSGAAADAVATGGARLPSGADVTPDGSGREGRRKSGTTESALADVAETVAPALEAAVDTIALPEEVASIPTSTSIRGNGERKARVGIIGGTAEEAPAAHTIVASDSVAAAPDASAASTRAVELAREPPTPPRASARPAEKVLIGSVPHASPGQDDDGNWVSGVGQAFAGTTLAVVGAAGGLVGVVGDVAGGVIGAIPVLSGILGWFGGEQQEQNQQKQEQVDEDDPRKPAAGSPNGESVVNRDNLTLGGEGTRASDADVKSESREERGVDAEGDAGGEGANTGAELCGNVGSCGAGPSRSTIDVTGRVDDGKVTDVLTNEGGGDASNGTDDRSTVDGCAGSRVGLARSSEATAGKVDRVDEVAESAGRSCDRRAGERVSPAATIGEGRRQGNEDQQERSDLLSGIASWTLSSAEAIAGGAVILLLTGLPRDKRQGEGERSSGMSSRVVEGGRQGSVRETEAVG